MIPLNFSRVLLGGGEREGEPGLLLIVNLNLLYNHMHALLVLQFPTILLQCMTFVFSGTDY